MKTQDLTFRTASSARTGGRLAVLAAVCLALTAGFVASLATPPATATAAGDLARGPSACVAARTC